MSKALVTRLFIAGVVAVVVGMIVAFVAVLVAIAGGVVSIGGPAVVTVNGDAFAGMVVWLVLAALAICAGTVAALAAWIGALLNTAQLEDKTWFLLLLVLGLLSFGWIAMAAYVIAGPDGTSPQRSGPEVAAAART